MPENEEYPSEFTCLPTEVVFNILVYLPAKDFSRCRRVCRRWKDIIDEISKNDRRWRCYCERDFEEQFVVAYMKCKPPLKWKEIYRTLTLWPKLASATEKIDEFAAASDYNGEIRNLVILKDGLIGVHKRSAVVYYDIDTLELSKERPFEGDYMHYTENDDALVLSYFVNLYVYRKFSYFPNTEPSQSYGNVKTFLLHYRKVFYVTMQEELYLCEIEDRCIRSTLLLVSDDSVMNLGYSDGHLNVLTFQRNIYKVIGNKLVFQCTLGKETNLLHQLRKYNFLESLDWRVYFQWMCVLRHPVPEGPLDDIIVVRTYGNITFVGSNWGVLRIYCNPYVSGEFDLFNSEPVKQYNFMERPDCPVLCTCPIIQIDVMELDYGHVVVVAMPKKIAVLEFKHDSMKPPESVDMLPYADIQTVKMLTIDDDN